MVYMPTPNTKYILMVSLNAASCNMHAQFAAWENGNWIANSRTLAT